VPSLCCSLSPLGLFLLFLQLWGAFTLRCLRLMLCCQVVGSLDQSASRYAVEVRTQTRRQETIAGLWDPANPDESMIW